MTLNRKKYSVCLQLRAHRLPNKKPKVEVWLNDNICSNFIEQGNLLTFDAIAEFGNNSLKIKLLNKNPNDTIVDDYNQIINDLSVELTKLTVNNIDITNEIKQLLVYKTTDNETPITYGYMHKNGTINIDFQCPIFYFTRNRSLISQKTSMTEIK